MVSPEPFYNDIYLLFMQQRTNLPTMVLNPNSLRDSIQILTKISTSNSGLVEVSVNIIMCGRHLPPRYQFNGIGDRRTTVHIRPQDVGQGLIKFEAVCMLS